MDIRKQREILEKNIQPFATKTTAEHRYYFNNYIYLGSIVIFLMTLAFLNLMETMLLLNLHNLVPTLDILENLNLKKSKYDHIIYYIYQIIAHNYFILILSRTLSYLNLIVNKNYVLRKLLFKLCKSINII